MVAVNGFDQATAGMADLVFDDLKEHCGSRRISSDLVVLDSLRKRHHDYHVTSYSQYSCDLLGYAAAGHAEAEIVTEGDAYDFMIMYTPATHRLERQANPGKLVPVYGFAQHKYSWNGTNFLVYQFNLRSDRGPESYFFLLAPRSVGTIRQGQHSISNELITVAGVWTNQLHKEIFVFDAGQWVKNNSLWKSVQSSTWDEVILDSTMKANLIEDVQGFFDSQPLYTEFQVPWKRGIIFHGQPGNGKTISIKALIAALQNRPDPVPSLYVKSFEACQGNQYSIRTIFSRARTMAPCLLIFEDLDSLITDTTRSYFLNEVDGLESNDGILMIGSTNHLDKLDPAIRDRPSRFDRKYHYKLPERAERISYARFWREKLEKNPRLDFPDAACDFIATMTEGFSFAYMKELFVAALLVVARGGKGEDKPKDIAANVIRSIPSTAAEIPPLEPSKETPGAAPDAAPERIAAMQDVPDPTKLRIEALAALEIPETLRDNVLVKVIRQQVQTLLEDMDSNTAPDSKRAVGLPEVSAQPLVMPPRFGRLLRGMMAGI